jgi:hypothetical protein
MSHDTAAAAAAGPSLPAAVHAALRVTAQGCHLDLPHPGVQHVALLYLVGLNPTTPCPYTLHQALHTACHTTIPVNLIPHTLLQCC